VAVIFRSIVIFTEQMSRFRSPDRVAVVGDLEVPQKSTDKVPVLKDFMRNLGHPRRSN
jgi:hypothetical protein